MKDPKATVRLSESKLRAFKVKTARTDTTIQEVLERAINEFLAPVKAKI